MNFKEQYINLLNSYKQKIKINGKKLRNEDIAKELGYNRSYLSTLIGEKGVVTQQHLDWLKLKMSEFPTKLEVAEHEPPYGAKDDITLKDKNKIIGLLEKEIQRLESERIDLKIALDRQAEMYGHLKAIIHHLVKLRLKAEKVSEAEIRLETNNIVASFLKEADKVDIRT